MLSFSSVLNFEPLLTMKTEDLSALDYDWHNCDYEIKEQDRFLPIANVGRVMKKALPKHAKLSKELKECIQECVSEFISFITSQASDKCKIEKRKTLNGEDILWSMFTLGFENYAETLKIYLAKYRQVCIFVNQFFGEMILTKQYEQLEAEKKPPKKKKIKKEPRAEDEEEFDYDTGSEGSGTSYSKSTYSDSTVQQHLAQFPAPISSYNFNQSQPINFYQNPQEPGPSVDLQTLEDFVSEL